jgi:ADP-ribose pyrophosphatase YjhB (NUDIX family)
MEKELFKLKSDQIDFTHARWTPVINCVVKFGDKILLVQRSAKLNFYPGYWNGVSGFLDDQKSLRQKVYQELKEELGLSKNKIKKISLGEIFDQEAPQYKKTWIVHPVLVEVMTNKIKIDWEATGYRWFDTKEVKNLKLLPGFAEVLRRIDLKLSTVKH